MRPNWAAIAGSVKIFGGPILIWMDFNTWKRERARDIGTDWNRKSQTRKMIVFRLERSCRIYDIFGRHNSYFDGFQCFFFIFIPWSALGAFVRVKAHVMVRRPLGSVRHRTSRPPSYVLHIV